MMLALRRKLRLETERLTLRPPVHADYTPWTSLRRESRAFLTPWEPVWAEDHLSRRAFTNRVYWASRSVSTGTALPLFLVRREDAALVGAVTLDNIRRGPAQAGTLGYWVGERFARRGYMSEAITAVVHHAFERMGLSRIEAACLPENVASRGLLERSGFKYEGVAQSYLQINGRWRTHVLYASLRADRRGRTSVG
jgi:ribosomal-protein-alanine N-acetyltransferase